MAGQKIQPPLTMPMRFSCSLMVVKGILSFRAIDLHRLMPSQNVVLALHVFTTVLRYQKKKVAQNFSIGSVDSLRRTGQSIPIGHLSKRN